MAQLLALSESLAGALPNPSRSPPRSYPEPRPSHEGVVGPDGLVGVTARKRLAPCLRVFARDAEQACGAATTCLAAPGTGSADEVYLGEPSLMRCPGIVVHAEFWRILVS
jgi:hypothetical protein